MSAFYAVLHWGLMFAALGATIVHVMLWHGKAIYRQYKTNRNVPLNFQRKLSFDIIMHSNVLQIFSSIFLSTVVRSSP
jgi:hypothetical protein